MLGAAASPDFKQVFEAAPARDVLLRPDFRIAAVTDAYLHASSTTREAIMGRNFCAVFRDCTADSIAAGVRSLRASLERVLRTRRPDILAVHRYDMFSSAAASGPGELRWSLLNSPVINGSGEVAWIIHRVEEGRDMARPQARAEAVLEGWPTEWRSGERTLEEVSLQGPEPRTSPSAGDVYRLLALRLQAVREEERARLARELHDQLGGLLTGIKVDLGVARHRIRNGDAEGAIGKVEDASRHVDLTIQATRRIATDLRPAILDHLGVVEALEFHAGEFQERTGIDVRVLSEWGDYPLHTEQRTALFRIVQECLTNVVRHARASAVTIALKGGPVLLTLSVTDNGAGFSPSQHRVHSLGLLGMTERARAVNATLSVDSAPGAGTRVTVQLRTDGK